MSDTENNQILGSSPSRGTNFPQENEHVPVTDTTLTQETPVSEAEAEQDVKWPKRIKHRRKVLATIYNKSDSYPMYRVAWTTGGRRQMKAWPTYSEAKEHADELVKDLAKGSEVAALTPGQANDARSAIKALQTHFEATGRRFTLHDAVTRLCDADKRLDGHLLSDAIDKFLNSIATVKRVDLGQTVTDFIEGRKHLGESKDGKRSKHSPVYEYNVAMWLNEFAGTFPGSIVCDLTKEHLNTYIAKFKDLSAKSRNDRRAIVKQFLGWCVAKDYLAQNHRLFEAVDFKTEDKDHSEIDFYGPKELRDMLTAADSELVPVLALGGLAGIRREEIMRLHWADVWRVKGKVEIGPHIAKGRKRRLVSVCPALAAWLRSYRNKTGPVWGKSPDALEDGLAALRESAGVPARRNGLRHAFITFHMVKECNENLTAAEAGNSPQMIHEHYRGLATKKEAVKWFAVKPAKTAANMLEFPTKAAK